MASLILHHHLPNRKETTLCDCHLSAAAEAAFEDGLGMAGRELLDTGLKQLTEDFSNLCDRFQHMAGGQE
jgi:hypothetical protein